MKIICAPDSFKESLTAAEAADAMARGVLAVEPDAQLDHCPIADGGEGTVDAMLAATRGIGRTTAVRGPLGSVVHARWGILGRSSHALVTAVIEMASASGLALVAPGLRDPTRTSTFGTGQLVGAALDAGARRIILGIGGSATTDGGCAMAQALGVRFFDHQGQPIRQPIAGGSLERIGHIDLRGRDPRLEHVRITVACDVTNPLTGPEGAAHVYGPQKGADRAMVERLDAGLSHLAKVLCRDVGRDVEHEPGAGAAGGLGAGLIALLGAELRPGIDLVLDAVGFDARVKTANLCLTGEGKLDGQSLSGKACLGVTKAAAAHGVPTFAMVGALGEGAERTLDAGLAGYRVIGEGLPAAESMERGAELLEQATRRLVEEQLGEMSARPQQ